MKRKGLPKFCSEFEDRHGKWRVRFRRRGVTHYFQSRSGTDEFAEEYRRFLNDDRNKDIGKDRERPGSISALIAKYYKSGEYAGLADLTKRNYRHIMERFRKEHGNNLVAKLERKHVRAIIAQRMDTPSAANNLLRVIHLLMKFAIDEEWRKDNPTLNVKPIRVKNDGFLTWNEEEIRKFEMHFPIGTKPRLAMALLLYTGQRRQDVVVMGRQHIRDGRIHVVQHKTGTELDILLHTDLRTVIDQTPIDGLTFITTHLNRAFTAASFGAWFKQQIRAAGVDDRLSAHGLRKALARRMAEGGRTMLQISSVTGHKTLKEVSRYTEAADQMRLADTAIGNLSFGKPKTGTEIG